jgi:hypothetical protein
MLVTDRFPLGELVLLNGFVLVPDIKLLTDVDVLDEDGSWIEVGLDEEIEFVGDAGLEVETELDGDAEFEEEDELVRSVDETLVGVPTVPEPIGALQVIYGPHAYSPGTLGALIGHRKLSIHL